MNDTFAYDRLQYPSHVHPQMHPSRLCAIARLHGIAAASPADCNMLEVGCGDGLQLVTLALAYPQSRFTGVDMSHAAIARGEAIRARLGLENLRLVSADLLSWDPGPTPYDYIAAHGFYSWVPPVVRERLLGLCGQALSAAGIAYISYNALPGCHLRRMMWDMLRFHVRNIADPGEKIERGSELLALLQQDVLPTKLAYGDAVRQEAAELLNRTDASVLFHDDMADINQPFTLMEFVAQANAHELAYLAEADYFEMNDRVLATPEARERLAAIAGEDRLVKDQYLDFLKGRRFRQTVLCQQRHAIECEPDQMQSLGMQVVGQMRPELAPDTELDLAAGARVRFVNADEAALVVDHPVCKAALALVGEAFPFPIDATDLLERARNRCPEASWTDDDPAILAHALTAGFQMGLLTLHCDAPAFSFDAGERPIASPLARLQIEEGHELVFSLRPSMVRLESRIALELVRLLDGSRDRAALARDRAARLAVFPVPGDDGVDTLHDGDWWQEQLSTRQEDGLQQTARMALLLVD
jgi:hypothetical protein